MLQQHLDEMALHSPPESTHALDLDALRQPDIRFWTAWDNGELLGCGALKHLDASHSEIKSMRTAVAHKRRGIARAMLVHLIEQATAHGYKKLSLETGSAAAFQPACHLYAQLGFAFCAPFANYIEDPHSVFMTRSINA